MTNKIRQMVIETETHEITIIRTRCKQNSAYCEQCGKFVAAFTYAQVAAFLLSIESGDIHLIKTARCSLVCGNLLGNTNKYR